MVVGGGFDAGDVRQPRGEQAALQHGGQPLQAVAVAFGFLAHLQQLALVGPAVGGLENHGPDQRRHVRMAIVGIHAQAACEHGDDPSRRVLGDLGRIVRSGLGPGQMAEQAVV